MTSILTAVIFLHDRVVVKMALEMSLDRLATIYEINGLSIVKILIEMTLQNQELFLKVHLCYSIKVIFAAFKQEKDTLKIPLKTIKTGLYADDTGYRFGKVSAYYISIEE